MEGWWLGEGARTSPHVYALELGYPNAAGVHLGRAARGLRASRAAMPNTTAREARWGRAGLAAAVADCTTANGSPSSSSCQTSSGGFPSCRRLAGRRAGLECAQVDRPAPPGGGPPRRVACLGDSLTAGVGAREASETYPVQLQAALGEDWAVSNFGAPGMRLQRPHNRSVHPRARVASVWRTPQWETVLGAASGWEHVVRRRGGLSRSARWT